MNGQTAGSYLDGYLLTRINTTKPLNNLVELDLDTQGAWYHEDIHFIQNVTTTWGLVKTSLILEGIYHQLVFVQNNPGPVQIPLTGAIRQQDEDLKKFIQLQEGNYHLTGVPEPAYNGFVIDDIDLVNEPMIQQYFTGSAAQLVKLKMGHPLLNGKIYQLGYGAITEQIAYLLESKFYNIPVSPKFPYGVCEMLAHHIFPAVASDPALLLAVCEVSLLHPVPGWCFYQLLTEMSTASRPPATVQEIMAMGRQLIQRDGINVNQIMHRAGGQICHLSGSLFQGAGFANTVEWLQHVVVQGIALRNKAPMLFSELYSGKEAFSSEHAFIMTVLGGPNCQNQTGNGQPNQLYHKLPEQLKHLTGQVHPQSLLVLRQMSNYLLDGIVPCQQHVGTSLQNECITLSGNSGIVTACGGRPWNVSGQSLKCPFASFWWLLKLDQLILVDANGQPI